ncbi:hypothetical protein [Lysobacter gummosus]|uniref:hypothetical protein n=1 Tax=Lysobacter gummosus TaxID=262324 RepID=UPI003625AC32
MIARIGGKALWATRAGSIHKVPVSVAIHNRPSPPRTIERCECECGRLTRPSPRPSDSLGTGSDPLENACSSSCGPIRTSDLG